MLQGLQIENYALIHSTQINLSQGFTSICGETGAGKSILLGALGLVLGQRADSEVLLDKEKKCCIEATFKISPSLKPLFEENDLDYEIESIFRREILPSGKSRAFINDTPVSLSAMKQIGDRLVDIHSQHNTINLNDKTFQLSILDSHLTDLTALKKYKEKFKNYLEINSEIKEKKINLLDFQKESSFTTFLYEELEKANLKEGEQEELQESVDLMSNAENIKTQIESSLSLFETEDYPSVITNLYEIKNKLSKIESLNKTTKELYSRTESAFIELKDIFCELQDFNEKINYDPQLLEANTQRLDLIFKLQNKHNVETVSELLQIKENLSNQINQTSDLEFEIKHLEERQNQILEELTLLIETIYIQRQEAAQKIEKELLPLFESMGMKNAVLKIEITKPESINKTAGEVEFLFNANKTLTTQYRTLNKVASGGELSRLMVRTYGDQSFKQSDKANTLSDEMADVLWVLLCLANQTGVDLTEALQQNFAKKNVRDADRHKNNEKLK
jgi:DNA repair protein RecN (Recombination protein N)